MLKTEELIKVCTQILNRQQQIENEGNMAQSPAIIFFLGNISYSYMQHVKNTLDANLKNGSFIQYLHLLFEEEECQVRSISLGKKYANVKEAIQEACLTMFGTDDSVFSSKKEIYYECLLCSLERDAEEYYEEYLKLYESHNYDCIKTLYLMIDQQYEENEAKAQKLIERIKNWRKQSGDSSSVYLLSDLLYDGGILREDRIWQNYRLVADLILLGNTAGSSGTVHDGIMTAAYTFVGKPLDDIAKISLYYLMDKLYEREEKAIYEMDSHEQSVYLKEKLNIGDAGIGLIDEIFEEYIQGELPDPEAYQWLPWKDKKTYRKFRKRKITEWQEINEKTCGVLDNCYKVQYETVLSGKTGSALFVEECRKKMQTYVKENFSFFELLRDLNNGLWKKIIHEAVVPVATDGYSGWLDAIDQQATRKLKQVFHQWAAPMLENEFQRFYDQANYLKETYQDALAEVRKARIHFDKNDDHLELFYKNEVEQFLQSDKFQTEEPLFRLDCSLDDILEQVGVIFEQMIRERSIYGEPFEREEKLRLKDISEIERSKIIKNRLKADVTNQGRLHLNYSYREQRTGSFCLVNSESVYMEELKKDEQSGTYAIFDLKRRDCLEMVELYKLPDLERIVLKE